VDTAIPPTAGTILREFPRTEYSMTGQGQQIMVVALWGPYTRPRIALEPSFL